MLKQFRNLFIRLMVWWVIQNNKTFCYAKSINKKEVFKDFLVGWKYPHSIDRNDPEFKPPMASCRFRKNTIRRGWFGGRKIQTIEYHPEDLKRYNRARRREQLQLRKMTEELFDMQRKRGSTRAGGGASRRSGSSGGGGSSRSGSNSPSVCNHQGTGL